MHTILFHWLRHPTVDTAQAILALLDMQLHQALVNQVATMLPPVVLFLQTSIQVLYEIRDGAAFHRCITLKGDALACGRIEDGEEWALVYEAYDKTGSPISLNFDLGEYIYIPQRDVEYDFYEKVTTNPKIYFDKVVNPS